MWLLSTTQSYDHDSNSKVKWHWTTKIVCLFQKVHMHTWSTDGLPILSYSKIGGLSLDHILSTNVTLVMMSITSDLRMIIIIL